MSDHVYVLRENTDKTEGRGPMRIVAICTSEKEASKLNERIMGVQGIPKRYGGRISKFPTNAFKPDEERVFDPNAGWADGRLDSKTDPEYAEYLRLKEKFE